MELQELVRAFKPILSKPVTFRTLYDDYLVLNPAPPENLAARMKDWSTRYPSREVEISPAFDYLIRPPFVLIFETPPRYVDIIAALADQYQRGDFEDNDILSDMQYVDDGWLIFVGKDRGVDPVLVDSVESEE